MDNPKLFSVITTIQPPTPCVRDLAALLNAMQAPLIIVGDSAGPIAYPLAGTDFWSLERQRSLNFSLSSLLPTKHYSRKNLGYLVAMSMGAECIYETDDDNAPLPEWTSRTLEIDAVTLAQSRWINVYRWFSESLIWPRGLPLEFIRDASTIPVQKATKRPHRAPIQQGLADIAPDVDAVWRLVLDTEFRFNRRESVVLPTGSWCPFNSQTTWWWYDAFPLLYLPSHCSFRMTDIWRSFVAQRCLWEMDLGLAFHAPEVYQDRNPHSLLRDFDSEIPGYLRNDALISSLEKLQMQRGVESVTENVVRCYERLIKDGFMPKEEMPLVLGWAHDIEGIRAHNRTRAQSFAKSAGGHIAEHRARINRRSERCQDLVGYPSKSDPGPGGGGMLRDCSGPSIAAGSPQIAPRFEHGYGHGKRLHANQGNSEDRERTTSPKVPSL